MQTVKHLNGNSGDDFASLAQRNTFTGINIGTQMQKVNTMLQVKCHDFNQYVRAVGRPRALHQLGHPCWKHMG